MEIEVRLSHNVYLCTMVNRIVHIFLAFLILVSTGGVTIYHHYCGQKLISTTIDVKPDDCCNSGCEDCRTDVVNLKVKTKVIVTQASFTFKPVQTDLQEFSFVPVDLFISSNIQFLSAESDIGVKPVERTPLPAENQEAFLQVFLV